MKSRFQKYSGQSYTPIGDYPSHLMRVITATCSLLLLTLFIVSCSDSSDDKALIPLTNSGDTTPFFPAAYYEARCASPRSGTDPSTDQPYPDTQGSVTLENQWLRSWSNDTYLWYDEIDYPDPAAYNSTLEYFDLLKTAAVTPSGNPKDKFHFTYPTDVWQQLSQSGVSAGYGAQWVIISGTPPRQVLVAYTEPGTPATNAPANLVRGAEVRTVDGVDVVNGNDVNTLNAAFFPAQAGENHSFTVRDPDGGIRSFSMQSADITSTPVQNVSTLAGGEVGYMLFNDHIATAEEGLVDAINALAGISDLVIDLRYNGGGYLAIASELAYMVAGPTATGGQAFETMVFNNKHPDTDPVTGQALTPLPFIDATIGFSGLPASQPLPSLNLSRVFVLTGPDTCSASESIINGLRGINVEVIQIGSTTCGKPYGFYPTDNCGTTYFTIQFRGENALNFGDYSDGFSPANAISNIGTTITGCSVGDDFTHALGDAAEARLAAALNYRQTSTCPAPSGNNRRTISGRVPSTSLNAVDGHAPKPAWLQNRIMTRR